MLTTRGSEPSDDLLSQAVSQIYASGINIVAEARKKSDKGRFAKRYKADADRWNSLNLSMSLEELVTAINNDPVLGLIKSWKTKPEWSSVAMESAEIKFYYHSYDLWHVDSHGLTWFKWILPDRRIRWKMLLPKVYVPTLLHHLHDIPTGGHFGERRTLSAFHHAPVYWFDAKNDIKKYCRYCEDCFTSKTSPKKYRAHMQSFGAGEPLERIAMDIAGPFRVTDDGNQYIFVVQDYFTKYVVLIPVPDHKAETLAKKLISHVFSTIGIPKYIHSDQASEFCSAVFSETCQILGIEKTRTTPFRPQSDGMVERMNRVVNAMLRQYVNELQSDWDQYLPLCSIAYNSTVHSSTGFTPNQLMFGRELHLPLELILPEPDFGDGNITVDECADLTSYSHKLKDTMKLVYANARENLKSAMLTQKHYYDAKSKHRVFHVGDSVWFYNPRRAKGRSPKLDKCWQGPFGVVATYGPVLVEIRKGLRAKSKIVHVDKLAHTKTPITMDWVHLVPKLHSEVVDDFTGFKDMFAGTLGDTPDKKIPSSTDELTLVKDSLEDSHVTDQDKNKHVQPDNVQTDVMAKKTRSGLVYNINNEC
jgi:transposase InsO family protein